MIVFNHLPVSPLRVTSKFGPRNTGIKGASTYHKGIDLGRDFSKAETPILCVADGAVFNNYWNDYKGWVVIIDHGNFKTLYQHLKFKSPLAKGEKVKAGRQIGIMGASTKNIRNMAMHLHMELIVNGKQIDPLPYLQNISYKRDEEEEEEMKRYNKVEELPKGLQKETQELINSGALKGDANSNLDITEDMVRCMIINKRYIDSKK
ncbi:MAG: M23 family metallopeptidase [Aminipila sp.]